MEFRRVGVIGSGQMGTGIAQVSARAGYETVLVKMTEGPVDKGKQAITKALQREVDKERCSQDDMNATIERLSCTNKLHDLSEKQPERAAAMAGKWQAYAERCMVFPSPKPKPKKKKTPKKGGKKKKK